MGHSPLQLSSTPRPIRIAVFGWSSRIEAALRVAADQGRATVVAAYDCGPAGEKLREWFPLAHLATGEAPLPSKNEIDAALLGPGASEARVKAIMEFLRGEVPVLATLGAVNNVLDAYELDILRSDQQAFLVCDLVERRHPLARQLASQVSKVKAANPSQDVTHIAIERVMLDAGNEAVLAQLLYDLDLARGIFGEITRLHAMGRQSEGRFSVLDLQWQGTENVHGRWSLRTCVSKDEQRGDLAATLGVVNARLEMSETQPWKLLALGLAPVDSAPLELAPIKSVTVESAPWDSASWSCGEAFVRVLEQSNDGGATEANWPDAIRAAELREAVLKSLAKGKTIELHHEQAEEQSTFKSVMASVGCFLLLAAPVALVVCQLLENFFAQLGLAGVASLFRHAPLIVALVLILFLASQVLLRTIPRSPR